MDKIGSERIRGTTEVVELSRKVKEEDCGHVMRREETCVGKRVVKVQGRRRRGRLKRRWMDCMKESGREKQMSEDDVYDRTAWRRAIRNTDRHIKVETDVQTKKKKASLTLFYFLQN